MPIGTVTMILANVGMQIYNNWCNGRQNEQLQRMREEFEQAARDRQTERMWQLMREGQELTLQLEEEKHQQRIDELKNDVGDLLLKLAYENAINNWPLNVLPIVMKNQALGNLLANQEENIAVHCIFTPSNCPDFNKYVYSTIEKALEQYCNLYWSPASGHPVLFYSGAWRGNEAPTGVQIESMRTALSNLPTLLITPFFRPSDGNLVIQLRIWGVGAASNDNGMLSDLYEFEPSEKEFQREYNKQLDFASEEGLIEDLVEDLVPYLQCLIGYMADTYFWSSSGLAPLLPHLLMDGSINTDGMKYLVNNSGAYYEKLLQSSEENLKNQPFVQDSLLNLFEGSAVLWNENIRNIKLKKTIIAYFENRSHRSYSNFDEILKLYPFNTNDIPFLKSLVGFPCENKTEFSKILNILESICFDPSLLEEKDKNLLIEQANKDNAVALYRLGEIYEYSIETKQNPTFAEECYCNSAKIGFILAIFKNKIAHSMNLSDDELYIIELLHNSGIQQASLMFSEAKSKGLGCPKSPEQAVDILNCIKNSQHPYYYYLAATILMDEYGDEEKSAIYKLMKISADMGYVSAIEKMMMIYTINDFVKADSARHFEYAQKAAEQGSLLGITRLGYCYAMGIGVEKDIEKAKRIISIAAKRGYSDAIKLERILISNKNEY